MSDRCASEGHAHERVGKGLRFMASDGYVVGDPAVLADWQEKVERLVSLVAIDAGASKEARSLAQELQRQPRLDLST